MNFKITIMKYNSSRIHTHVHCKKLYTLFDQSILYVIFSTLSIIVQVHVIIISLHLHISIKLYPPHVQA